MKTAFFHFDLRDSANVSFGGKEGRRERKSGKTPGRSLEAASCAPQLASGGRSLLFLVMTCAVLYQQFAKTPIWPFDGDSLHDSLQSAF
jgi:hypothetical protein